jgi:hypothetical protein
MKKRYIFVGQIESYKNTPFLRKARTHVEYHEGCLLHDKNSLGLHVCATVCRLWLEILEEQPLDPQRVKDMLDLLGRLDMGTYVGWTEFKNDVYALSFVMNLNPQLRGYWYVLEMEQTLPSHTWIELPEEGIFLEHPLTEIVHEPSVYVYDEESTGNE